MFKIIAASLLLLSFAPKAYAMDTLELKCYPPSEVLTFFKQNGFFIFYQENTKPDQIIIAAQHNDENFVERGLGYNIKISTTEACVRAKGRILKGPRDSQLSFESLHKFGGEERTAKEWKELARNDIKNRTAITANLKKEGHSDKSIEDTGKAIADFARTGGTTAPGEFSGVLIFDIDPKTHHGKLIGGQNGASGQIFGDKKDYAPQ